MTKEEKKEFIKKNYKNMSYNEMAKQCNCSTANISKIVSELLQNNELSTKLEFKHVDDIEGEIWKQLDDIKCSNYYISNMGRIKNNNNILLKDNIPENGYHMIKLFNDDKKYKNYLVHRLVAIYFVNNTDSINKIEVDHIDANKDNNKAKNLQ